jgi:hypothetical protein
MAESCNTVEPFFVFKAVKIAKDRTTDVTVSGPECISISAVFLAVLMSCVIAGGHCCFEITHPSLHQFQAFINIAGSVGCRV